LLRHKTGLVQLISDEMKVEKFKNVTLESCVCIEGIVTERPGGQANSKMDTGEIEVQLESVKSINQSEVKLPFYVKSFNEAQESLRLKHRYLDLRHLWLQENLRLRSEVMLKMRNFLAENGFIEVETPTLFRRTPGGAREFLVPTHIEDHYFSLVQSPQQFKQLLMIGGVGKYFQIARCYRDEGSRPDRQPEFTQVDIELSFTDSKKVRSLTEALVKFAWPSSLPSEPFQIMTYETALTKYGIDKPDLRFDNQIVDICHHNGRYVKAIWFKKEQIESGQVLSKSAMNKLFKEVKTSNGGPIVISYEIKQDIADNLKKFFPAEETDLKGDVGDFGFIVIGDKERQVQEVLGKIRANFSEKFMNLDPEVLKFLWIIDFPLFLVNEDTGELESAHHPFTRPLDEDMHLLKSDPEKIRAQHYDLVLNGQEIGGGETELQKEILEDILKEDTTELEHMLEALSYGCPPHGGIALGLDRLMMIICKAKSIRDVIAFPKTAGGKDLMSGSPTTVKSEEKEYYHLK
jgi:aspartyl-tRNA synthetase